MSEKVVTGPFGRAEFETMILDAEFTRDILFVYADEKEWPSKIGLKVLRARFPEHREDAILFHLKRCQEAGLLDAQIGRSQSLTGPAAYFIGSIDGLTYRGSEFVLNARNPRLWEKAVDKCIAEAGHIGLTRLMDALMSVAM